MGQPLRATVHFDGASLDAFDVRFGIHTDRDQANMPQHASLGATVDAYFDINDRKLFAFSDLKKLFDNANVPTNDKVKDVKIEVWADDARQDCLYSAKFKGWISSFNILTPYVSSGNGRSEQYNAVLHVSFAPVVNREKYQDINFGN